MKWLKWHKSEKLFFIGLPALLAAGLVFIFSGDPPDRDYPTPPPLSSMDERRGICRPDGLTQGFADVDNDGNVDCIKAQPERYAVFLSNSAAEARVKRWGFIIYMIREEIMWRDGGYKSPEEAIGAIIECDYAFLPAKGTGCKDGNLLPYPGAFPVWVSRYSERGKFLQAEFERLRSGK